ncbi:hypothetical protein FY036_09665 [Mesorhizobium microcysteis]|uniref:GAP family protein n=1 Tax=Neoaquamicrobium microcysteis TaxID=2682781 RepID=A0A5D4H1P7_9HYPH|nr:GAP family protein [Mesorhizobium microcysteis]TYR32760.1 hypothetical protein FY036_09665 [Mesorhizobium microcysteis]
MLSDAIGAMLPAILAVALTPIQLVGVVVVLGRRHASTGGWAFLTGWLAGLTAVTVAAILLVDQLGESGRTPTPFVHWLQIALGLVLVWMAVRLYWKHPAHETEPQPPKWLAAIGEASHARALAVGASMALGNPKILALVVAAMTSLAYLNPSVLQIAVVSIVFVLLASAPIIAIVAAHGVGGEKADARIENLKGFLLRNSNLIMAIVFAMLGVSILGKGIAGIR